MMHNLPLALTTILTGLTLLANCQQMPIPASKPVPILPQNDDQ